MTLKSVFSVELDDSEFKRFKALYDKYQESVTKLPKGWEAVGAAATSAGAASKELTGTLDEQVRLILKKIELEKIEEANAARTLTGWQKVKASFTSIDKSLENGIIKMAKWGAVSAGVLGGLGAIGIGASLFGIDRLSGAITNTRRTALGQGNTYGGVQSFNTNYSRLINPSGLLDSAATAKYDLTSPQYTAFLSAGVSTRTLKGGSSADIAAEYLARLPQLFKNVDPQFRGAYAKAYGVDQVMPMNDLNAFLNADPKERDRIAKQTIADAKDMDINDAAQRAWADFTTQLDRATKTIEAKFMEKLTPIEPGLEKLSGEFTHLVDAFADSGLAKSAIQSLSSGITWLSDEFGKKEFRDDLGNWFTWVGTAAKDMLSWVSSFAAISPANAATLPTPTGSSAYTPGDYVDGTGNIVHGPASLSSIGGGGGSHDVSNLTHDVSPYAYHDSPGAGNLTKLITQASKDAGIDPRIMEGIRAGESGHGNKYDVNDSNIESSWGPFQLNRKRGLGVQFEKETGLDVRDPRTIPAQAEWVAKYIKRTGSTSPWMGFHGLRDADPRWGDAGYDPERVIPRREKPISYFPAAAIQPLVRVRSNTGNDPVLAHALTSQPSTTADKQ